MAKIFYLGRGTHVQGRLRAVVSLDQLESLLSPAIVTHVGHDFPLASDAPITLIEISHEEATATWPAGFCRVDASPTDFDDRLRFLPEPNNFRREAEGRNTTNRFGLDSLADTIYAVRSLIECVLC